MSEHWFSVVIPLYNKELSIKSTIESVLAQTYREFEIIVIDDGSTDASAQIVAAMPDGRIRLIKSTNGGVSAARNLGISYAQYKYVAFLDADDLWQNDYLDNICHLIDNFPDAGIYATFYLRDKGVGRLVAPKLEPQLSTSPPAYIENYFVAATFGEQPFFTSSVCVPREILLGLGGFKLRVKYGEDLDMWARIALYHRVAYTREPKVVYRTKAENRAMRTPPELLPWVFRDDAKVAMAAGNFKSSFIQDIKEHIATIEFYTVILNFLNPDCKAVLAFLHGIETVKFARRKTVLDIALQLPLGMKRLIVQAHEWRSAKRAAK
jgi:glycosyltransferase involved in cell wall biosynthesis